MARLSEGDRIELVHMPDDPDPIAPGTRGTVTWDGGVVTALGAPYQQVSVRWDNGRTLGLAIPPDIVKVIE